ncbi:MAG: JmjC domain-containing protein [Candidatus Puniceispirillales bacterium]
MQINFPPDFFTSVLGDTWLHQEQAVKNISDLINYEDMSSMLNMWSVWTPDKIFLMDQTNEVPSNEYFDPHPSGSFATLNTKKLLSFINSGCSVVLNDVTYLNSKIRSVASFLEKKTGAQVQANIYFSMGNNKAFGPHFDTHDVLAIHCQGSKDWNIYKKREEHPINSPQFKLSKEENKRRAGELEKLVTLNPGDFLYLPRGHYHDALAATNGAIHIAFGLTKIKPIDLLNAAWSKLMTYGYTRSDLGRLDNKKDVKEVFSNLSNYFEQMANDDQFIDSIIQWASFWTSDHYQADITSLLHQPKSYKVSKSVKITNINNVPHITDGKNAVKIPDEFVKPTNFILSKNFVTQEELEEKMDINSAMAKDLLEKLQNMKIIS